MIRGFDGLRAIAVLAVIVWHAVAGTGIPGEALGPLAPLLRGGWLGVDLFFALSGFLITSLIVAEEDARAASGPRTFSLKGFYVRRGLRILPAYVAVLVLQLFVVGPLDVLEDVWSWQRLVDEHPWAPLALVTFTWNYYETYAGGAAPGSLAVLWSLCVEEHFYVFWSLFLFLVPSRRARVATAFVLVAAAPVVRALDLQVLRPGGGILFLTHDRFDAVLWGALLALLPQDVLAGRWRRPLFVLAGGGLASLVLTGTLAIGSPSWAAAVFGLSVSAVACALLVAEVRCSQGGLLARALEVRPLAALGRISYGVYLLHYAGLNVAALLTAPLVGAMPVAAHFALLCAVTVLVTSAAAACLYALIERPFLRLKDAWAPRPRDASTAPCAGPETG